MNAMHFDGLSGAAYVSLVAFSIVFIVLLGLTLGWFADACLEALLGRFGTERAVGSALILQKR